MIIISNPLSELKKLYRHVSSFSRLPDVTSVFSNLTNYFTISRKNFWKNYNVESPSLNATISSKSSSSLENTSANEGKLIYELFDITTEKKDIIKLIKLLDELEKSNPKQYRFILKKLNELCSFDNANDIKELINARFINLEKNIAKNQRMKYVASVIGSVLVVSTIGYFIYHTKDERALLNNNHKTDPQINTTIHYPIVGPNTTNEFFSLSGDSFRVNNITQSDVITFNNEEPSFKIPHLNITNEFCPLNTHEDSLQENVTTALSSFLRTDPRKSNADKWFKKGWDLIKEIWSGFPSISIEPAVSVDTARLLDEQHEKYFRQ